jgi:hypothetical protein
LILLVIGFYCLLECLVPLRTAVQIGGDEGFELAKATLCSKGFRLYEQVWNDQPPLHTWLVTKVIQFSDQPSKSGSGSAPSTLDARPSTPTISPLLPRLVSVFFGAVLIGSLFLMAWKLAGLAVATIACVMLICSPGFLGLSASCMLEVPAYATAVAAMAVLVVGVNRKADLEHLPRTRAPRFNSAKISLVSAAILFGASIMMKLVPLMLAPLFVLILYSAFRVFGVFRGSNSLSPTVEKCSLTSRGFDSPSAVEKSSGFLPILFSLSLFSAVSLLTFILLDVAIDHGAFLRHFSQTWTSHFGVQQSFEYGSARDHPFDWSLLWKHWDATVPAVLGLIFLFLGLKSKVENLNSKIRLPFIWLVYALLVFALHKPWWSYYYVHIAAPLAWCAAIGIYGIVRSGYSACSAVINHQCSDSSRPRFFSSAVFRFTRSAVLALFLLAAIAWSCGRVYLQIRTIRESPQIYSDLVIPEIARFKPFTQFLYADEPIYSFHTGIPMPPNLAVVMYKRLWSGDMTNDKITAELAALQPGLILLKNDTRVVPFKQLLETEYRLVYYDSAHRLYAHRSIARKAPL